VASTIHAVRVSLQLPTPQGTRGSRAHLASSYLAAFTASPCRRERLGFPSRLNVTRMLSVKDLPKQSVAKVLVWA
jgi:hypothetical protein